MPLLMIFLKGNWKPLLIAGLALLWSLGCYNQGRRNVQADWDAENAKATTKARQIESDNTVFSNIIEGKHYANIKTIDDSYNAALHSLQQPASSNLSAKGNAPGNPHAAACDNGFYKSNKRKLLEIGRQADYNTQKLLLLQQWEQSIK